MVKSASNSNREGSDSDISNVEEETIKRVNKTMKSIEEFLAKWEGSKLKAGEMLPQVERIKEFHKELGRWQKDAVTNRGRGSYEARMKRLEDFIIICRSYS